MIGASRHDFLTHNARRNNRWTDERLAVTDGGLNRSCDTPSSASAKPNEETAAVAALVAVANSAAIVADLKVRANCEVSTRCFPEVEKQGARHHEADASCSGATRSRAFRFSDLNEGR